jgi:tetratricopeptide (TPR) repeat protein
MPTSGEAVQLLGLSYYLGGHPADAIPLLEKVQGWYPRANVDASYILGICYIQTKDYPHARAAFAKMFDVPSDSAASYCSRLACCCGRSSIRSPKSTRRKPQPSTPSFRWFTSCSANCFCTSREFQKPSRNSRRNSAINPAHAATYYKLADAYSRIQKFDDAERLLQRSIWLDATSTGPYILMGKVLEKKGEFELAIRALQRAAAMDPNNPITHHLLGQAYRDMGKKEEAESELKLAEQLQTKQDPHP